MNEHHLARRRPLWSALSDFFLDTETRWYLPNLAEAALVSGYPWPEVDRIFLTEVYPVLAHNLEDVAGEWAGFPEPWLSEQILARLEAPPSPPATAPVGWLVVQQLYQYLAQHREQLALLNALARCLVESDLTRLSLFQLLKDLRTFASQDVERAWEFLSDCYQPVLGYPGDPSEAQRSHHRDCLIQMLQWLHEHPHISLEQLSDLSPLFGSHPPVPNHPQLLRLRQARWGSAQLEELLAAPIFQLFGPVRWLDRL